MSLATVCLKLLLTRKKSVPSIAVKCYRFPIYAVERILHIQSDIRVVKDVAPLMPDCQLSCLNDKLDNVRSRFTSPEFKLFVGHAVRTSRYYGSRLLRINLSKNLPIVSS